MDYLQSNEYVEYLKKNYGVRGYDDQDSEANFTGAGIDIFLEYIKLLEIQKNHKGLEVGCGLGRLLKELYDVYKCELYGIDKNSKAIELAKVRIDSICKDLKNCGAEDIDFPQEFFDFIICWGVFELCNQEKTLSEMARCLKVGGKILLTGKSHDYHKDDVEAYSAEVAITEKKIHHGFSHYDKLLQFGKTLGLTPFHQIFFERRGYFSNNKAENSRPLHFYEWLIVFQKKEIVIDNENRLKFSVQHSLPYDNRQNR